MDYLPHEECGTIVPIPMQNKGKPVSFGELLWEGFVESHSGTLGVVALGVAIVAWKFTSGVNIPLWGFISACCVLILPLVSFVQALRKAVRMIGAETAQVLTVKRPHPPYADCKAVCIVSFSQMPPVGALVYFFKRETHYERPIGSGLVKHIQTDKSPYVAHVTLDRVYDTPEVTEFVKSLGDGKQEAIADIRVNLTVTASHIAGEIAESKTASLEAKVADPALPMTPSKGAD